MSELKILSKEFQNLPNNEEKRSRTPSAASLGAIPDSTRPVSKASRVASSRKCSSSASSKAVSSTSTSAKNSSSGNKKVGTKAAAPVAKSSKSGKASIPKRTVKKVIKVVEVEPKPKAKKVTTTILSKDSAKFAKLTTKQVNAQEKAQLSAEKKKTRDLIKNEKGKEKRRLDREKAKMKELRQKLTRLKKYKSISKKVQAEIDQVTMKIEKQKEKVVKKDIAPEEQIVQEAKDRKAAAATRRAALGNMDKSVNQWEGNSDDEGSVDSACLEENICFSCGENTNDDAEDDSIVVCDRCEGEIHLGCLNLGLPPRKGFICPRCKEDEAFFDGLKYDVYRPDRYNMGKKNYEKEAMFPIPKPDKSEPVGYLYSPSRPLHLAWDECRTKGFMAISRVFDLATCKALTHGNKNIRLNTARGRTSDSWPGALRAIDEKLGGAVGGICTNIVDRGGRYDMRIPDFVIDQLQLNEKLKPVLTHLATIMGTPVPSIRTQNVVFCPVGSPAQPWHTDDSATPPKFHRYFTILIHLNPVDENCGGTEVYSTELKRYDIIRNRPGDAFVFNGSLKHRGQSNEGQTHRLFYYAAFSCRADQNVGFN